MSSHEGIDPNHIGRREFFKIGAVAGVAVAIDGAAVTFLGEESHTTPAEHGAPSEGLGHDTLEPAFGQPQESHDSEAQVSTDTEHGETGVEEHNEKFFDVNLVSALPVVAQFGRVLGKNLAEGDNHREFGKASFVDMLSVEAPRMLALKLDPGETSQHQFEHEATDLAISYGLMGALVTAAEVTEHADADEAALFEQKFGSLVYKMEKGLEDRGLKPEMPSMSDGKEAWEAYAKAKGKEVLEIGSQNFAIGTIIAPIATTYTSATMANALNGRMAQSLAELKYSEKIANALDGGSVTEEASVGIMTEACEESDQLINGRGGYVEMTLGLSANLQGAGFFGDPPNFFYIKNNGAPSWVKASAVGVSTAAAIGFAENAEWMTRALGRSGESVRDVANLGLNSTLDAAKVVKGMGESTILVDQALRRNKRFSDNLHVQLDSLEVDNPDSVNELRGKLEEMPRAPFAYDFEGLARAVKGEEESPSHSQNRLAADVLLEMYHDEEDEAGIDDTTMVLLNTLIKNEDHPKDRITKLIDMYAERGNNIIADQLGRILSDLVNTGELTDEGKDFVESIRTEDDDYRIDHDGSIATNLTTAIENGDVEDVDGLIRQIDGQLGFLPSGAREAIRQFWAIQTDSDVVDPNHKIGGLGHASKEVLAALATQILAANSCAVVASKFLDALGNRVPFQVKKALVLTIDEGLSAVADNVVAYVSTEIVMDDMYTKEYGEDVFEGDDGQNLKDAVTSSALFAAVAGGAMSKIGNGPNFKFEKPVPKVEEGEIKVTREPIALKETLFKNRHSFVNGGLIIGQAMLRTYNAEQKIAKNAEQEAASTQESESTYTRRGLFSSMLAKSQQ